MDCRYVGEQTSNGRITRLEIASQGRGEEYAVCCPFCNDTRYRLSINHRWGVKDVQTGTLNLWLAKCYNEDCLTDYSLQRELYNQVYDFTLSSSIELKRPETQRSAIRARGKMRLPTGLWPLEDMCLRSPRHPALTYLHERLFDPVNIGRCYKAMYCVDNIDRRITGRLVVPIIFNNKLAAWQARLLRAPLDKKEPKWFTAPGSNVGSLLYNGDNALQHQTVVIVEGITDVWGFGLQACGVFKKAISPEQLEILQSKTRSDATLVVLFDPDQAKDEKEKGKEHHIVVACKLLQDNGFKDRVLPVYLPTGTDPGDLDRSYMRRMICHGAAKQNKVVCFSK